MNADLKKCKFVILDTMDGEIPVLIPMAMPHDYFDEYIILNGMEKISPISAGFFDLEALTTYGESTGLKLKPRPEDAEIIKTFFNLKV